MRTFINLKVKKKSIKKLSKLLPLELKREMHLTIMIDENNYFEVKNKYFDIFRDKKLKIENVEILKYNSNRFLVLRLYNKNLYKFSEYLEDIGYSSYIKGVRIPKFHITIRNIEEDENVDLESIKRRLIGKRIKIKCLEIEKS